MDVLATPPPPPWWARLINASAECLHETRLLPFSLSAGRLPGRLWRAALEERILDDLQMLLDCFDADGHLNALGRLCLRSAVRSALQRRLLIRRDLYEHPEILRLPIAKPLFVVGLPRSGTTLLQMLLCHHPGCRWLRPWELEIPFPKLGHWGGERDRRRRRYQAQLHKLRQRRDAINAMHPPDSPAECWPLLWASFVSHTVFLLFGFNVYRRWSQSITSASVQRAYAFYYRQLQHLGWHQPGCHWVLKAPEHTITLAILLEHFPDAQIIHLHRDPVQVIPSLCSLAWYYQYPIVKGLEPHRLGAQVLAILGEWGQKITAARRSLGSESFYDLHYCDLVNEPLRAIEAIYDWLDRPLLEDMRTGIRQWLAERHGGKRPQHRYTLDAFGLQPEDLNRAFADYRDCFRITPENVAAAK